MNCKLYFFVAVAALLSLNSIVESGSPSAPSSNNEAIKELNAKLKEYLSTLDPQVTKDLRLLGNVYIKTEKGGESPLMRVKQNVMFITKLDDIVHPLREFFTKRGDIAVAPKKYPLIFTGNPNVDSKLNALDRICMSITDKGTSLLSAYKRLMEQKNFDLDTLDYLAKAWIPRFAVRSQIIKTLNQVGHI